MDNSGAGTFTEEDWTHLPFYNFSYKNFNGGNILGGFGVAPTGFGVAPTGSGVAPTGLI
jgi:hypothetical protein